MQSKSALENFEHIKPVLVVRFFLVCVCVCAMYFWQKWSNRCKNELAWESELFGTCILSFSLLRCLPACLSLSACCCCCLCVESVLAWLASTTNIRILHCRLCIHKCEFNKPSKKNEFSAKQRICEQKAFRETSFLTCNEFIAAGSRTVPRPLALCLLLSAARSYFVCILCVSVCVCVLFICLGMLWGFSFTECCAII